MQQNEIRGFYNVWRWNTAAAVARAYQYVRRCLFGKQDQLMHTALLQNFVMVGTDVAFIVDFKEDVGVTLLFHDPLNGVLNSALDSLFVSHTLVLAEIENAHDRGHTEIVGPV